ncbi:MAG: low specificity L-threonine aldolase [Gemmatimonadetes bacterium]|nr:low specificity L-threonine aldolase [Gemmatimonadota bacterium]
MSVAREFASDNTAPAHPAVLEAMAAANHGPAHAYGADAWTAKAVAWFRDQFGGDTAVFPVWNGTGANVVSLRALTRPYHAVLCTQHSHIQVDECGAPELLTGCKLLDLPSPDARLTPAQLRGAVRGIGNEHAVQPHVLSLTQTTEYGTAYSVAHLTELCGVAHELGLRVHMDGARIANAAATLGVPMRAFARDAGVDVLSFGATKNGGINAEAVLVFDPALAAELPFLRKQSAQLASKMRFQSAQFLALAEGEVWLENARHANAMAGRLEAGLRGIAGVTITQPVEANAVFAVLPTAVTAALQERFHFYVWNETSGEVRLMASWATQPENVDEFVTAIAAAMLDHRSSTIDHR